MLQKIIRNSQCGILLTYFVAGLLLGIVGALAVTNRYSLYVGGGQVPFWLKLDRWTGTTWQAHFNSTTWEILPMPAPNPYHDIPVNP